MPPEESRYAADWLRIKAFLLSKGWQLQRIHDREALLNRALMYLPTIEQFRGICQQITGFYVLDRYPFLTPTDITADEVDAALQQSGELTEILRQATTRG